MGKIPGEAVTLRRAARRASVAHYDATGMRVSRETLVALEEAASQKGESEATTGRTAKATRSGPKTATRPSETAGLAGSTSSAGSSSPPSSGT